MTFHLNPAAFLPAVILFLLFWIFAIGSFVMWRREAKKAEVFCEGWEKAMKDLRQHERRERLQGLHTYPHIEPPDHEPEDTDRDLALSLYVPGAALNEKTRKAEGHPPTEGNRRRVLPAVPPPAPPPAPRRERNVTHIHHHHNANNGDFTTGVLLGSALSDDTPRSTPSRDYDCPAPSRASDDGYSGGSSGSDNSSSCD